ncbi:MAG: hypothetical protein U1E67_08130 [Hyphomicrobiales bacterium]
MGVEATSHDSWMGQAKIRQAALREHMLAEGKKWEFPTSERERLLCEELLTGEIIRVRRAPDSLLRRMGLKSQDCHSNVWWYVANDPEKKSKAVVGWWLQWPDLVLHSVIRQGDDLICITPQDLSNDHDLHFIPDQKVSWRKDIDGYVAIREGEVIGEWLRIFPEFTMARIAIIRERLLSGIDPIRAIDFGNDEFEVLKQRYIPREAHDKYARLAKLKNPTAEEG